MKQGLHFALFVLILIFSVYETSLTYQAVCCAHYINHLVWSSQKLYGSDFIVLPFSQMRKPWPREVMRHAQVYLVHNWPDWDLTCVSPTQAFAKPLYCIILPLLCQGSLPLREDTPLHHFSYPRETINSPWTQCLFTSGLYSFWKWSLVEEERNS